MVVYYKLKYSFTFSFFVLDPIQCTMLHLVSISPQVAHSCDSCHIFFSLRHACQNVSGILLMIRPGLWVLGRKATKIIFSLNNMLAAWFLTTDPDLHCVVFLVSLLLSCSFSFHTVLFGMKGSNLESGKLYTLSFRTQHIYYLEFLTIYLFLLHLLIYPIIY